ncbi:MAG: methyltransferase domain-containing protein [Kiloniellaceae bacterium]
MFSGGKPGVQDGAAQDRRPFRERFLAWWEGYELIGGRRAPAKAVSGHPVRYEAPRQYWETSRLRLVQEVWGEGFSSPGRNDHILNMITFLGLDPAMSVLDIGAGLGGATRAMCQKFGVWITGLEADETLAEAGMALSTKAGLGKKAPIVAFDPESFEYKPKSIDCVFSKEFLFTVEDKPTFLRTIENLLKSRGQLLFTDYVLAKPHLSSPAIDKWIDHEPRRPSPWSVEDYQEALAGLHLDIRVVEDTTQAFHKMVTQAWAKYIVAANQRGIDDEVAPALVDEVELWTRRMQVIEIGDIKVCRIHVLKKDTERLMSNW